MLLSEIKKALKQVESVEFQLPDGSLVPEHFHVTEVGAITKHFIDCGGTERKEKVINFQLWTADDYDHRLSAQKLNDIIGLSERILNLEDAPIEVEYQGETIGKYGLEFNGGRFILSSKHTDCLAKDNCGIPQRKPRIRLSQLKAQPSCEPGSGCC
jgi:hypothetical protein